MEIIVPQGTDKIGFISDIYGSYENVLKTMELKPDISYWFCAGDMYAPVHMNAPTLRLMANLKIPSAVGNHDRHIRKESLSLFEPESQDYLFE